MTDSPQDSDPTLKPRGLWAVIAHSSGPITSDQETDAEQNPSVSEPDEPAPVAPRSLFAVMQRAQPEEPPEAVEIVEKSRAQSNARSVDPAMPQQADRPVSGDESIGPFVVPIGVDYDPPKFHLRRSPRRIRQSSIALLCGVASIPLSALSIRPEVWMSIPASGTGFIAIILGYMALTGCRLRDLSTFTKTASQVGMLLGTLGIFLGPLVFARVGRELRESSGHHQTRKHLNVIGDGLERFYDQHGVYPIGGTFVREKSGAFRGQHGWMTFLLPYIGEQRLYAQIDQTKPFDAAENRLAMGHDVEVYYAAGGDRTKIGQGFAVAHFAGVGGDVDDVSRLLHAGIFARDIAIKKSDVSDGLANTLIVGELAGNYAPWGDPENWRTIGKGLNKDVNGFGNAAGTGAMFLLGDGSVKMFSNKTDPKLLKQLSTRDGGE